MSIVAVEPAIPRDRYQRPLVVPPSGGKAIPYTRCTTYVGCLEDTFNLAKWQQRMVAIGLAKSPDLMLGVTSTDPTDKRALDQFCEQAKERAQAGAAATTGTALHALTERIDRGQEIGVIPDAYQADLDAYVEATKNLKPLHIEKFCVQDTFQIGGTPDRVVRYQGKNYIADLKTGNVTFGTLKIAMQLAVYARSQLYDVATGERTRHDAEVDKGLVVHLPAGTGECHVYWIDLLAGWEAVKTARVVREHRKASFAGLTEPFAEAAAEPTLEQKILACRSADEVRALWTAAWGDDLNNLARDHIATLAA